MIITNIELKQLNIPLKKPFKTALRTVTTAENVIVIVSCDDGSKGYGAAPPTKPITGDTKESIIETVRQHIAPALIGMDAENLDAVLNAIQSCVKGNPSPKAACDMAIYDLFCKKYGLPLYKLLGGYRKTFTTDLTISLNDPAEMREDALKAVSEGFDALKLKVGINSELDIARVKAIREAVGPDIKIRLDANQGWTPDEAVATIKQIEAMNMNIEFVEQPVAACDIEGLKYVRDNVNTAIMADESLFSPVDAIRLLETKAVDILNIKLMKCGGIYNALKIVGIAETYGVECMLGCMIESKVSLAAAAHLAAGKKNITRVDLDAAILLAADPVSGVYETDIPSFRILDLPGLGINEIVGLQDC